MQRGAVVKMGEWQLSDGEVARSIADGRSPELLFHRYYRPLVAALAVSCGNRELAADCIQDAFVELCRRWSKIGGYEKPEAWLMRVAVNRVRSEHRSLRRRTAAIIRMEESVMPDDPPGVPDQLVQAFQHLPARQRLACSLFYILDLSLEEVARTMGISMGAAGAHLHRARNSMRSLLEETS